MATLAWQRLADADLPALAHLARRCLAADGGLPLLAGEPMLRQLFLSGESIGGRDETGDLVAAASVYLDGGGHRTATGLIHPSARRQGLGEELVRWCRERSGGALLRVVVETTSPEWDALRRAPGAAAHLRRARHAPPARRHPADPATRGPAGLPVDRGHGQRVPRRLPTLVRRPPGLPGHPARRVGRRGGRGRRLPARRPRASPSTGTATPPASSSSPTTGSTRSGWCPRGAAAAWARTSSPARCAPCARPAASRPGSASTSTTPRTTSTSGSGSRRHGLRARYEETQR